MDLFLNRTLGKIRLHRQVISEAKQIWSAISWVDKLHSWCSCGSLEALAKRRCSSEHTAVRELGLLLCCDFHQHLLASLTGNGMNFVTQVGRRFWTLQYSLCKEQQCAQVPAEASKTQWHISLWSWLAGEFESFLERWHKSVFWEK